MRSLRRLVRILLDVALLSTALIQFAFRGTTPRWAVESLVRLFCVSGGRSNDLLAKMASVLHPPRTLAARAGVLALIGKPGIEKILPVLRDRGYFVYEQRVPADICDRLVDFALTQPASVRLHDGEIREKIDTVYDPSRPLGIRYDFREKDLINNPDIQALMADPAIIEIAQAYLGVQPVADVVAMWWHTAFSDQPDSEAAQFYHFDMDRIKWIKFFIYLTDVSPDNGPHYFVAGSHRTGGVPKEILSKGYVRLSDEEVEARFPPRDIVEFAAPRGTIIAEDTRGLHKGQHVASGHRLMLQIQFSNSLFGPAYPKASFDALRDSRLAELAARYPRLYSNYLPEGMQG